MSRSILIFSLAYYPTAVGGAEVALKEITDRISPADIVFHMVTLRFRPEQPSCEQVGNIMVHRVGSWFAASLMVKAPVCAPFLKTLFLLRAALAAASLHRQYRFDGLWAMMAYMTVPITLGRLFGVRIPYVITLQEGDTYAHVFLRRRVRMLMPLIRRAFRQARVVTVISHFLAPWAREFGYDAPVIRIPNGVDSVRFGMSSDSTTRFAATLGKKEGDVWLIHTGRAVHKNGLDLVIRALPLLPAHIHFLQVGSGTESKQLRSLAQTLGVDSRYHEQAYVPLGAVPAYLHAGDIFVRPSRSEGMGNSFVEAMAAGLPVIGTREGGIADFLFGEAQHEHPQTGYVVPPEQPEAIASAVTLILADESRRQHVVATARTMVALEYNWDTIAATMTELAFKPLYHDA